MKVEMLPMLVKPRIAVYHDLLIGGALRAAVELTSRTSAWFDYQAIVPSRVEPSEYWRKAGVSTKVLEWPPIVCRVIGQGAAGRLTETMLNPLLERRVADIIDDGEFDLLLVHPSHLVQTPGLLRRATIPTVYFAHEHRRRSFEPGYNRGQSRGLRDGARQALGRAIEPWLRHEDRLSMAAPSTIFCNSAYTSDRLKQFYGRDAIVVHLGVDEETFVHGDATDDDGFVLSVGGLEPAKGHGLLVQSVAAMNRYIRPRIVVVFDREAPGHREWLVSFAKDEGVELVLREAVVTEELVRLYQRATVTFCGAAGEPFGLTPLESIACGTPVVAVRAGGYVETVRDHINGLLVDPDPLSISCALEQAFTGALPRGQVVRSSILPYWTWEAAADRYALAVEACLNERR